MTKAGERLIASAKEARAMVRCMTDIPQHIHMHIIEPGRCTYYIDDVLFDDDERLTSAQRRSMVQGRGGVGLAKPQRDGAAWRIERDIELGKGIRDYAACGK